MIILSDDFDSYAGDALPPWANPTPTTAPGRSRAGATTGAMDGVTTVSNPNMAQVPASTTNDLYWLATDVTDGDGGEITVSCYVNCYLGTSGIRAASASSPAARTADAGTSILLHRLGQLQPGRPGPLEGGLGGSETQLALVNPSPLDTIDNWALVTLQLSGTSTTTCTVTVQDLATGNYYTSLGAWQSSPTSCISYADSSSPITGAGYGGLFMTTPSAPATGFWDNFTFGNAAVNPPSNPPVVVQVPFGFYPANQF